MLYETFYHLADKKGFEPLSNWLTASRSTVKLLTNMEDPENFEISTRGLKGRCSASELRVYLDDLVGFEPTQ
jgi:hypothetical protein